jgi:ABC-type multidrug transport system fused ATPase/permease subunit
MVNQTDHTTEMETYTGEVPNTPLRFLWYITKPHKIVAVPAFVFATAASILDVLQVYVVAQLVDNFTLADTTEAQLDVLFYGGLTFFGVLAVNMLLWVLRVLSTKHYGAYGLR